MKTIEFSYQLPNEHDAILPTNVVDLSLDRWVEESARQVFAAVITLDNEVTIYVPSKDQYGHQIPCDVLVKEVQQKFKELIGGFTSREGSGSSQESPDSVREIVVLISSFTTTALLKGQL